MNNKNISFVREPVDISLFKNNVILASEEDTQNLRYKMAEIRFNPMGIKLSIAFRQIKKIIM